MLLWLSIASSITAYIYNFQSCMYFLTITNKQQYFSSVQRWGVLLVEEIRVPGVHLAMSGIQTHNVNS
jgi:hypothetical protein